jgi:hypothetical protein
MLMNRFFHDETSPAEKNQLAETPRTTLLFLGMAFKSVIILAMAGSKNIGIRGYLKSKTCT